MSELNHMPALNNSQVVADLVKDLHGFSVEKVKISIPGQAGAIEVPFAVLPQGKTIESLNALVEPYLAHPKRVDGTARLTELDSFIAHANTFKTPTSTLFARDNAQSPGLIVVYDYHHPRMEGNKAKPDAAANWCKHRAAYDFPVSDEWKVWHAQNKQPMSQTDFAAFLEDHILDVLAAPDLVNAPLEGENKISDTILRLSSTLNMGWASPTALIELSRGLTVTSEEKVQNITNLQTGEASIQFTMEHQDAQGKPLKVPGLFLIGIPVFARGDCYQLAVRLRYRKVAGDLVWFYELYRADLVFDHAFREACESAKTAVALPLIYGAPEQG